jgi:Transposase DDE domain group 1
VGEELALFPLEFNGSIRIESRPEKLSSEAGAVVLREIIERYGITTWLTERLHDPRNPALITHPLQEMLNTWLLLLAQGWRDRDDADTLRDDPVLRLAASSRRGTSPLEKRAPRADGEPLSKNPPVPDGLASQPTLSRLGRALSSKANCKVLREGLLELASRRIKTSRAGHRMRYLTVDVDSLPVEVHGHQPGSEHNGHYHARIYHPIVATAAGLGDLLDLRLREGNVHTADGALSFIGELIDRVQEKLCQVAAVRIDAGFPEENLLAMLEARGTPYVARVKNNAVLDGMAEPFLKRPPGRPPAALRTWLYEMSYRAESWSRSRRVVLVVLERANELFLHHFWLITNWNTEQMSGEELLEHYRQRGTAEGYMGELMNVLRPALSSAPRPKTHYRGEVPTKRTTSCAIDAFAHNEVILLVNALAYNVAHVARTMVEAATHEGWSLQRVRERVLRVACRVLVHGRRVVLVINDIAASLWSTLWSRLRLLRLAES